MQARFTPQDVNKSVDRCRRERSASERTQDRMSSALERTMSCEMKARKMKQLQGLCASYSQVVNNRWKTFSIARKLKGEDGSIEPALVLIPLLILILSTLQVASGVLARTTETFRSQASLYSQALFSNENDSSSQDPQAVPPGSGAPSGGAINGNSELNSVSNPSSGITSLPGGGALLTGNEEFMIPSFTPLLPGGDRFAVRTFVMKEGSL